MNQMLTADLDALRELADKQRRSASVIRGFDLESILREPHWGLAGSDVAAQCARAGAVIESALGIVAARVDRLAETNRRASAAIGATDDDYATSIHAVANLR